MIFDPLSYSIGKAYVGNKPTPPPEPSRIVYSGGLNDTVKVPGFSVEDLYLKTIVQLQVQYTWNEIPMKYSPYMDDPYGDSYILHFGSCCAEGFNRAECVMLTYKPEQEELFLYQAGFNDMDGDDWEELTQYVKSWSLIIED